MALASSGADDARAHGDDLRIVGQGGALGRIGVMGQRGADARHLVGRDQTPMPVPQTRIALSYVPSSTPDATRSARLA